MTAAFVRLPLEVEEFDPSFNYDPAAYELPPSNWRMMREQHSERGAPSDVDGRWRVELDFDHVAHWKWQMKVLKETAQKAD